MAWSNIKEKRDETKRTTNKVVELGSSASPPDIADAEKLKNEVSTRKGKDLHSGMELLELDFLLSIVENTKGNDDNDVTMRRLTFDELLRRENQDQVDSNALQVYAVNADNLYGKDIQCEAVKELTKRTT